MTVWKMSAVCIQRYLFQPAFNERHGRKRRPDPVDLCAIGRKRRGRRSRAATIVAPTRPCRTPHPAPDRLHPHQINQSFAIACLRLLNCIQTHFFRRQGSVLVVAIVQKPAGQNLAVEFQLGIVRRLVVAVSAAEALEKRPPVAGHQRASGNAFDCGTSRDFFQMGLSKLPDNPLRPVSTTRV